ncbi:MAG TPA: TA system VapC family ribonuclease toxin [Thermoanaerobaculia bacterium]|nr:TA system VapC family ribonuclease toxin [Thermoanaerobaculia bacterium]
MIAVDTNVLVYAHREESPKHEAALARLTELAESPEVWAIPVFCLGELARVISHPRLFDPPHTPRETAEALRRLTGSPSLRILAPGPRYPELLSQAIEEGEAKGNLVYDAQIVALCREYGARALLTEDRDFDRFRGLATERLAAA